ncbi:MAG: hypothetical protein ACI4XH_03555 [Acutalibacteraceae bacterium]
MKKIIAAAISILVGTFGFTIVDKELIERVDNLEYSVSSMQEQIDQMEPSTYETTKANVITSMPGTTQDSQPLEVGYEIPVSENQMKKFLIEWNGQSSKYIKPGNDNIKVTSLWTTSISISTNYEQEYFIYIDKASAKVSNIYEDTSSYYDSDYSVCTKVNYSYEIDVCIKGYTSSELAGNYIKFNEVYFSDIHIDYYETPQTIIKSDGTFEVKLSIDLLNLNKSNTLSFDSPKISNNIY